MIKMIILFTAIWGVESQYRLTPPDGKAGEVGPLQIRQCVISDWNAAHPEDQLQLDDARGILVARKVFCWYVTYWGAQATRRYGHIPSMESYARIWNGGPKGYLRRSTKDYWKKVESELKMLKDN